MTFLRPYNTLLTDTTAIYLNLLKYATPTEFAVSATWTPAAGDVKVSKDDGAAADIGTLPVYVTDKGWKFILSATELSCKQIVVRIADSATKVVCDDMFVVETTGNAVAMWPDYDSTNPIIADAVKFSGSASAADNAEAAWTGSIPTNWLNDVVSGVQATTEPESGTLQAATSTTATLDGDTGSTLDDYYNGRGAILLIYEGTATGQWLPIDGYVGATKVATMAGTWTSPIPDNTSKYVILV